MKTRLIDGPLPYKIVLSSENDIDKFNVNASEFARIKLRLSIRPDDLPGWRLDFTLVKTVTDIKNNLKPSKDSMLFELDSSNFINDAPWDHTSSIELEVEHIGPDKKLNGDDLKNVIHYVFDHMGEKSKDTFNYQKSLNKLASVVLSGKSLDRFKYNSSIRNIYNRVIELNRQTYFKDVFPNLKDFYLLEKADGIRVIGMIDANKLTILNGGVETLELKNTNKSISVFDAEYIEDTKLYYVFDVLVIEGENIKKLPTKERVKYIPKIVELCEGNAIAKYMVSLTDDYANQISETWNNSLKSDKYEVDGLIFTPKNDNYEKMKSWKWKPLNLMSIDFLVKEAPSNMIGVHPYEPKKDHTLMFLFSGIEKQLYDKLRLSPLPNYTKLFPGQKMYNNFPIQFSPSDNPFAYIYYHPDNSEFSLDDIKNNVCEFTLTNINKEPTWKIIRIRTDRKMELEKGNYFGNGFYVAEYTWLNYSNPLKFEDLILTSSEFMELGYFKEEKNKKYKPVTAFNSFVKSNLINQYKDSKWLVDLAGGHGQDMFRVSDANIKNALYLDSDPHALSELVSRKNSFQRGIKKLNTRIYTKLADLSTNYKDIIVSISKLGIPIGSIDVVMCNFAIHYLIATPEKVRNIINLISDLLKKGGHFFFTAFNGEKVFKLLEKNNSWNVREGEVLKYSINKKYTSNKFENIGQQIEVLLPFSGGEYYTEYLVNYDYILKEFKKGGFTVEKTGSFDAFLNLVKKEKLFNELTEGDIEFLSLYSYAILKKSK